MARSLQPCGTPAAYRRHLRNGEVACAECKAAIARVKMARLDGDRDERKVSVLSPARPLVSGDDESVDALADARANLRIVKAALKEAVPREVAALSKRRQELVEFISKSDSTQEVSLADQLAAARDARARRTGA